MRSLASANRLSRVGGSGAAAPAAPRPVTAAPVLVAAVPPKKTFVERVSAYVPIFISLLALGVALFEAYETRHHNMLSTRPSVHFSRHEVVSGSKVGLTLANTGLGPAVITDFSLFLDAKQAATDGHYDWGRVSDRLSDLLVATTPEWSMMHDGYALKAGEAVPIYVTPAENVRDVEAFRRFLAEHVLVRVHICSLYEECRDVCSNDSGDCADAYRKH